MKKSTKIIFICFIALIFCTVLFSMQLVDSVYARYKTTVSNSDNARVARFNITQSGTIFNPNGIEVSFPQDTDQAITLEITNNSEVAVEYIVTVTNVTGNIPTLQFGLNATEGTAPVTTSSHENGVSTNKVYRLPGNKTDKYTLNITLSLEESNLQYMGMVDYVTISVTATQVD